MNEEFDAEPTRDDVRIAREYQLDSRMGQRETRARLVTVSGGLVLDLPTCLTEDRRGGVRILGCKQGASIRELQNKRCAILTLAQLGRSGVRRDQAILAGCGGIRWPAEHSTSDSHTGHTGLRRHRRRPRASNTPHKPRLGTIMPRHQKHTGGATLPRKLANSCLVPLIMIMVVSCSSPGPPAPTETVRELSWSRIALPESGRRVAG